MLSEGFYPSQDPFGRVDTRLPGVSYTEQNDFHTPSPDP